MERRLAFLPALVVVVAAAAPSQAQEPPPSEPQGARMRLAVADGLQLRGRPYVLEGQRVTVVGHVKPYVAGQSVVVTIAAPGRDATDIRVPISRAQRGRGRFSVNFRPRRAVAYRVSARHDRTDAQYAVTARSPAIQALGRRSVTFGARGTKVRLLQSGLRALGFPTGSGGVFDAATARSVMAFRKTNSLGRDWRATATVLRMVFERRGRYKLRYPKAGKHVEADLSRQLLVLAERGGSVRVYHTSTGKPATPTVRGGYRFYRKEPGKNSLNMVHSSYFIRGYAIHGYAKVPLYPASAGCLRVPIPNARSIFDWIGIGDRIFVYG